MNEFIIQGGFPLSGEVTPSGNKNAALPLLAACILASEPVVLHNIPRILDVLAMRDILIQLGVEITEISPSSWRLRTDDRISTELNPALSKRIRASILLAGPLLARFGTVKLPPPGGDVIGRRRVDTHLLALKTLGAVAKYDNDQRVFNFSTKQLVGAPILLDEASVTATENAIMASVLARGDTVIQNAASEPHIQELCQMLNSLGAEISNIGSNTLNITGVESLHGGEFTIGSDYLEVVSYIGAAAVTRGSLLIKNAGVQYLDMIKLVFNRIGVDWENRGDDIYVSPTQLLEIQPDVGNSIPQINVMPWPAFPTDLMSIAIVVATQSKGTILLHDWMYEGRMYFTDKLTSMGAQIILCDPHRCIVQGPTQLVGETVESPDIRAGLALVLAALAAKGESSIRNIGQIDRGYERIEQKLQGLGARIERVTL